MGKSKSLRNFAYTGKSKKGQNLTGNIKASSPTIAKALLQKQGVGNIKLKLLDSLDNRKTDSHVNASIIANFIRQMSTMTSAGIPLVQALQVVIDGAEKKALSNLVGKIKAEVESGRAFSEALKKQPNEFDALTCNLVEAGEISGTLDKMLDRIAIYKEKSESLKRKLKKAMYYPITVLIIAAIVTVILLLKVVPTFKELFSGFDAELPAFTLLVLGISDTLHEHGLKVLGGTSFGIYLVFHFYKTRISFRHLCQRLFLRIPIFGSILHKAVIARFARTLATTFAAGVPLTDALTAVAKATGNIVFFEAVTQIREHVSAGQRMRHALQSSGVFPNMVIQMVAIGEESGSLEEMLNKIATIFEEEVDTAVDGLTTMLEPFIMLILGIIVGGLVVAMYLPIFKLGSVI